MNATVFSGEGGILIVSCNTTARTKLDTDTMSIFRNVRLYEDENLNVDILQWALTSVTPTDLSAHSMHSELHLLDADLRQLRRGRSPAPWGCKGSAIHLVLQQATYTLTDCEENETVGLAGPRIVGNMRSK
jgi:hypothetical protein